MLSSRQLRPTPVWGRNKLVALLAAAAAAGLLLVAGLGLAVYYTLHPDRHHSSAHPTGSLPTGPAGSGATATAPASSLRARQDALAARPMPSVDLAAAEPDTVSTRDPGTLVITTATRTGPGGVPTGFGHTPAGALAQLAAIDQTAMQSGSLPGVRALITAWAAPGGPSAQTWSGVQAMAGFLDAAGLSGAGSPQLSLVVTPVMGLVKGTIGQDFVVPCVDFEFDATLTQTQRVAVADCQRMIWQADRWVIGPGAEPAEAPSVWPDTDTAISVGYQDLRHG
jgi:hypothetical protein